MNEQVVGLPAWRLKKVLTFIALHLDGRIRLPLLAEAAGLSRMHFARLFRLSTGLSPHEYVLRKRVERAKALMLDSNDSIAEVARASGFSTGAYFANVFHRFVGNPPSRWRHSMRTTARKLGSFTSADRIPRSHCASRPREIMVSFGAVVNSDQNRENGL